MRCRHPTHVSASSQQWSADPGGIMSRSSAVPKVHRARGFTLVELMLGTLLVGILLAIALPSYSRYKDRVRTKACLQDIVVLSGMVQFYFAANGSYPNSLAEIGNDGKTDPWGRPYVYYNIDANGKGHARKDHALNPLNTDFDLYSPGPDGKTKPQITQKDSVDDILRASNGQFIGIAADF
jgi:general secretion pathway protein G